MYIYLVLWYPLLKQDKELTENVLGRASKLILEISNFSYPYRLCVIDIPNIKYCRVRSDTTDDMIQVCKVLHRQDESIKALLNVDSTSITRGHKFELNKPFVKNKVRKHFFNIQEINDWNSLPPSVFNTVSLDSLKAKLDKI